MSRQASPGAFRKLPSAEQERILAACTEEFAKKGYTRASTNAIVKRLGIPKGSIFYWFGSRDGLYLHLVERAAARFVEVIGRRAAAWPAEILARLRIIAEASFDFLAAEPAQYRLFTSFMDGEARHLRDRFLQNRLLEGMGIWARWFDGVDTADFLADPDEVRALLSWVMAGLKIEAFSRLGSESPPAALRAILLGQLDRAIPMLAHAIYRHPEKALGAS